MTPHPVIGKVVPLQLPHASKLTRSAPLDFLRGIAILLVLSTHYVISPDRAGHLTIPAKILWKVGWTGVDLFFVLSGFLVGGLLMKEIRETGKVNVARFLVRRIFKIWPAYYVFLALGAVIIYTNPFDLPKPSQISFWPNIFHLQNYLGTPLGITWSLAVEEHFYLFLPLVLVLLLKFEINSRHNLRFIPFSSIAVSVFCLSWRIINSQATPLPSDLSLYRFTTHLRMDSLFFGVTLAYFYHYRPILWNKAVKFKFLLALLGIILVSPALFIDQRKPILWTFGFTSIYLGYGLILMSCIGPTDGSAEKIKFWRSKIARSICFIGFYSYSIYLYHSNFVGSFFVWIDKNHSSSYLRMTINWLLITSSYVIASVMIGYLMSNLVEIPFLRLRDRLFPAFGRRRLVQASDETDVASSSAKNSV